MTPEIAIINTYSYHKYVLFEPLLVREAKGEGLLANGHGLEHPRVPVGVACMAEEKEVVDISCSSNKPFALKKKINFWSYGDSFIKERQM